MMLPGLEAWRVMDDSPTNPLTGGPVYEPAEAPAPPVRAWTDRIEHARWAFYAGLAGGVLILVAAFITALFVSALAGFHAMPDGWWGVDADDADGGFPEVPIMIGLIGLVTGAAVVFGALRTKERPDRASGAGALMLAGGVLSFLATGGFLLGGVLAIAAGVLAIAGSRGVWTVRAPRVGREPTQL